MPSAIARFAEEFGERHMECAYYFDFCRTRHEWFEHIITKKEFSHVEFNNVAKRQQARMGSDSR